MTGDWLCVMVQLVQAGGGLGAGPWGLGGDTANPGTFNLPMACRPELASTQATVPPAVVTVLRSIATVAVKLSGTLVRDRT